MPRMTSGRSVEGLRSARAAVALQDSSRRSRVEFAFLLRSVGYMTGLEFPHQLEISIDGERVFMVQVGGEADNLASDKNMSDTANKIDQRLKTKVKVSAGPHMVGVTFVRRNAAESDEPLQPHERNHDLQDMNGLPLIDHVKPDRSVQPDGPWRHAEPAPRLPRANPPKRLRNGCARTILSAAARRAYRRPVTEGRSDASWRSTGKVGRRATSSTASGRDCGWCSQSERSSSAPRIGGNGTARVSDLELASRLSFFLWSSIPDDTL